MIGSKFLFTARDGVIGRHTQILGRHAMIPNFLLLVDFWWNFKKSLAATAKKNCFYFNLHYVKVQILSIRGGPSEIRNML